MMVSGRPAVPINVLWAIVSQSSPQELGEREMKLSSCDLS